MDRNFKGPLVGERYVLSSTKCRRSERRSFYGSFCSPERSNAPRHELHVSSRAGGLEDLTARKKGFSVPLWTWMKRGLAQMAERFLTDGSLVSRGVFSVDGVRRLLDRRTGAADGTWWVLIAELWPRRWREGEDLEAHTWAACTA